MSSALSLKRVRDNTDQTPLTPENKRPYPSSQNVSRATRGEPLALKTDVPDLKEALDAICSYPESMNGIYVGFDFAMNLNLIAHRRLEKAYLYSSNPRELALYDWISTHVQIHPSRIDFLAAFTEELSKESAYYLGATSSAREFIEQLSNPHYSWLYNDGLYEKVRDIYRKGGFVHADMSLKESAALLDLDQEARKNGQVFDVISLYGTEEMDPTDLEKVKILYAPNTLLVQSADSFLGFSLKISQPLVSPRLALFHALSSRSFSYLRSDFHGHPFLLTTETGHPAVFEALSQKPQIEGGVYFGFAFEFNYHILARRPFERAYICDIHPSMIALYAWVKEGVVATESREAFIEKFHEELFVNKERYFPDSDEFSDKNLVGYLKDVFNHYRTYAYSWLKEDASYARVRNLYLDNRIVHLNLNLARDGGRIAEISQEVQNEKRVFDVVYITNIAEWVRFKDYDHYDNMVTNLQSLLSDKTTVVDSKRERPFREYAHSRVTEGTLLPDFTFPFVYEEDLLRKYRRAHPQKRPVRQLPRLHFGD